MASWTDILDWLPGVGGALEIYAGYQAYKDAREEGRLTKEANKKKNELDIILGEMEKEHLTSYEDALSEIFSRKEDLFTMPFLRGLDETEETRARLSHLRIGQDRIRDERGGLVDRTFEDARQGLNLQNEIRQVRLDVEVDAVAALGGTNVDEYTTTQSYYGHRGALLESGRDVTTKDHLERLRFAGQARGISEQRVAAGAVEEGRAAELRANIYGSQTDMSLLRQAQSAEEAQELSVLSNEIRERKAVDAIQVLGDVAAKQAGSGVAFNSASLSQRRTFLRTTLAKDAVREAATIRRQARTKVVEAELHGMQAGISELNMKHAQWEVAQKHSVLRAVAARGQGRQATVAREYGYQQQLAKQKEVMAVGQEVTPAASFGMLDSRSGMVDDKDGLYNHRQSLKLQQDAEFGGGGSSFDVYEGMVATSEEQAQLMAFDLQYEETKHTLADRYDREMLGHSQQELGDKFALARAGIDYDRSAINLGYRREQAQIAYEREGVQIFQADQAAQRNWERSFIDLESNRLADHYAYEEADAREWSRYAATVDTFNQQNLQLFSDKHSTDYQHNNRLAAIEHGIASGHLGFEYGKLLRLNANSAARNALLGTVASGIDLISLFRQQA